MNVEFRKGLLKRLSFSFALIFFLLAALFYLRYDIEKRSWYIASLNSQINQGLQAVDNLALLRQDFEKVKPYLDSINMIMPERDSLINLPRDLKTLASQEKVSLEANLGNERQQGDGVSATDLNFIANGNFDNLVSFLRRLKMEKYFMKFINFDLARFSAGGNEFKLSVSGEVFSQ